MSANLENKKLKKIKNFQGWKFCFSNVYRFYFDHEDVDQDNISLQLEIIATKNNKEKIFAFQNGGSGLNGFEQEEWDLYDDGCDNVLVRSGFNNLHKNDNELIDYLKEYLASYNYSEDYIVDDHIYF